MSPSRHQLPQKVSADRRRGRLDTLRIEQERFQIARDHAPLAALAEGARPLPPHVKDLPEDTDFLPSYKARMELAKLWQGVKAKATSALTIHRSFERQDDYHALYRLLGGDAENLGKWRLDAEFGRSRLDGVNPMSIQALPEDERTPLWEAAQRVLSGVADLRCLRRDQRLFFVDYADLWHESVQAEVRNAAPRAGRPVRLAAPRCLFWVNDDGQLLPLAIQLKPRWVKEPNPVFTPLDRRGDWQMARAHVACADAHVHEGFYHLLETHLVNEAVALCMYRQLHPDHPLRQLLTPHYQGTMAINKVARDHLLVRAPPGPIQASMAAGVAGVLNAARLRYRDWSFADRALEKDLEKRGVKHLPGYHYRDDALLIHEALERFVRAFLSLWYERDRDVTEDFELTAFLAEVASDHGGAVPGFPRSLAEAKEGAFNALVALVTHLIFRAGPQHAAVNNGQFDTYGETANGPGLLHGELPERLRKSRAHFQEADFWKGLPGVNAAIAQVSMVWVLSLPTQASILHTGQFPELDPALSFGAVEAIAALRRRLQSISYDIQARNERLAVPYRYLDPQNVSRSTDV